MKAKIIATLSLVLPTGCASSRCLNDSPPDRSYRYHVSDVESEKKIKGVTYDKGPYHPTFWETVFTRLGIK